MSQATDYTIANAAGSAVRADLNTVLDAIKTLNSGNSAPGDLDGFMLWFDTTNNQLKMRNSGSTAWIVVATFDSGSSAPRFEAADGSAGSVAYGNSGDMNTGVFFPAADQVSIACGGQEAVKISYDSGMKLTAAAKTLTLQASGADTVLTLGGA